LKERKRERKEGRKEGREGGRKEKEGRKEITYIDQWSLNKCDFPTPRRHLGKSEDMWVVITGVKLLLGSSG
jgi:hypothetical protein